MFLKKTKSSLSAVERISTISGLPLDAVTNLPYIRLCANREITIEDAGKLLHYEECSVKVKQNKLTVCIGGKDLKIIYLANGDLRVCGYINSVVFE